MADADELIVDIKNGGNVPDMLKALTLLHPNAGLFVFRSSKSHFPKLPLGEIPLADVNFDYLRQLHTNRETWSAGLMSRAIVRPDHIFRMGVSFRCTGCVQETIMSYLQVHGLNQFEKWKPTAEQIVVSPDVGIVLHLRRPITDAHPDSNDSIVTNVLTSYADRATKRWQNIVVDRNLTHIKWDYFAIDLLQLMENCLRNVVGRVCLAFGRRCGDKLKMNRQLTWVYERNTWTIV